MKNHYQELRDRQQEEVNAFPMFFAFDQRCFFPALDYQQSSDSFL